MQKKEVQEEEENKSEKIWKKIMGEGLDGIEQDGKNM